MVDNELAEQLQDAIFSEDLKRVRAIIRKDKRVVNARYGELRTTPLMAAAISHNPKIISELVFEGADVNAKDKDGVTALMRASEGWDVDIVKALLSHGAKRLMTDNKGHTAIDYALPLSEIKMVLCSGLLYQYDKYQDRKDYIAYKHSLNANRRSRLREYRRSREL